MNSTYKNTNNQKNTWNTDKLNENTYAVSIKERLLNLEERCHILNDDVENNLDDLNKIELGLNEDIKPYLGGPKIVFKEASEQVNRLENQIDKHFFHQKSENIKMEKDIEELKNENTITEQNLVEIDRYLEDIHNKIGNT